MGRKKKRLWETWSDWDNESVKCNGCGTPTDFGQGNQIVDEHEVAHRLCWPCWKRLHAELSEEEDERQARKDAGIPEPPKQKTLF